MDILEYYTVEHTWMIDQWFPVGGTEINPRQFETYDLAHAYAVDQNSRLEQEMGRWRILHTKVENFVNKKVITKEWFPLFLNNE